jgi:hypothetical protein
MPFSIDSHVNLISLDSILAPSAYERTWNRSLPEQFSPSSKSLSTRIDTTILFLQEKNVIIRDRLSFEDYLANNSGVLTHIYEVPNQVLEYVDSPDIEIGMFTDPDANDPPEMYFEIRTTLSPEDANRQLSLLNREWVFASGDEDLMKINFTLKFV